MLIFQPSHCISVEAGISFLSAEQKAGGSNANSTVAIATAMGDNFVFIVSIFLT